jgi:hypothetical protein
LHPRAVTIAVLVSGLAVAGAVLDRVVAPVWQHARVKQPALQLDSSLAGAGQGVTLALLGGFRALVADFVWLRMYALWEQRDLPATQTLVQLTTAIDPRPVYFWLNGARITGYDLAAWRILLAGGYEQVPESVQERIGREQAIAALRFLDAAMRHHPRHPDLWVERANLELNRLRDPLAAAESYRRAWEAPGGPYYAARLRAEVLRRHGRKAEALAWLRELHPKLPPNDDGAQAELVLARIRELERELGVPAEASFPGGVR